MGEFFAILTAFLWAAGVIFFKRAGETVGPVPLGLFKNFVAVICLAITAAVMKGEWPNTVPRADLWILVLSGVIGIGISDTLFLFSLNLLGASRAVLIDCLYSPFVILVSFAFLNETLRPIDGVGALLILSSILLSARGDFGEPVSRQKFLLGLLAGSASMLALVVAIVMIKPYLTVYSLPWLCGIRMVGGIFFLVLTIPFQPGRLAVFKTFRPQAVWKVLLPGAFIGSYLSLMAWLAGFKYTQTHIASILNQLSTVLVVLLAVIFLGERLTRLKIVALGLAMSGAVLVFLK